jgi:hypothetical protein
MSGSGSGRSLDRNESQTVSSPIDLDAQNAHEQVEARIPDVQAEGRAISPAPVPRMDINLLARGHFFFGRTLGEGSYARVVHARMKIENSPDFAIKIMEKSFIQKEKKVSTRYCSPRVLIICECML